MAKKLPSIFDYPEIWYGLEEVHNKSDGGNTRSYLRDVKFATALLDKYTPHKVRKLLEVACGNCPHGRLLAKNGYDVTGIDFSDAMLRAAADACKRDGVQIKLLQRDTERFTLDGDAFDAGIVLSETQPCGFHARNGVEYNHAMVSHLQSMAAALKPGAIYLQDWGHVMPQELQRLLKWRHWVDDVTEVQGIAVVRRRLYSPPDDVYGNVHALMQDTEIIFKDGRRVRTHDEWREPWLYPVPYHAALADLSGAFRFVAAHQYMIGEPGISPKVNRAIWIVLQRV